MRISGQHGPRRKKNVPARILLVLAVILGLALWADAAMRPAIENIVSHQVKVFVTRQINEAMLEQIERADVAYDGLVRVVRNQNGEITSIQADMAQINRLKSSMSDSVIQKLENGGDHEISIPLGNLVGNQLTSGHGPMITVKVIPTGYVQSEIFNRFSSAGINQTLHQIMLRVNVQMIAVFPGYNIKTETETNFCIAETVIVGEIPQGYASLGAGLKPDTGDPAGKTVL